MDRHPVPPNKRRMLEAFIRIIDIIAYTIVLIGGIYAAAFTPNSVTEGLSRAEWLVPMWAGFLLIGGALGAAGRISRVWILEPPALVLGIVGVAIYFVVLGSTLFESVTAGVATTLVFYAAIQMARRYVELQIFGTDPNVHSFADRVAEALRRRTGNVAPGEE